MNFLDIFEILMLVVMLWYFYKETHIYQKSRKKYKSNHYRRVVHTISSWPQLGTPTSDAPTVLKQKQTKERTRQFSCGLAMKAYVPEICPIYELFCTAFFCYRYSFIYISITDRIPINLPFLYMNIFVNFLAFLANLILFLLILC